MKNISLQVTEVSKLNLTLTFLCVRKLCTVTKIEGKKEVIRSFIRYSSLGLEMGLSVAIGIAIGYFLDRYFESYPYLTILFLIFGIISGLKTVYGILKKLEREDEGNSH